MTQMADPETGEGGVVKEGSTASGREPWSFRCLGRFGVWVVMDRISGRRSMDLWTGSPVWICGLDLLRGPAVVKRGNDGHHHPVILLSLTLSPSPALPTLASPLLNPFLSAAEPAALVGVSW